MRYGLTKFIVKATQDSCDADLGCFLFGRM
jgi:hypothetical protein